MSVLSVPSVAGTVRDRVMGSPAGTFLRRRDFDGSDRAVESALSRLAAAGELIRVRRGLYWRGAQTRFGMTRPSALDLGIAVGGPGSGPSGIAAAHLLGLTTQVPSTMEVAVPGKVPEALLGVRFRSRPFSRRELRLRPVEVAVLELLRDPGSAEASWDVIERCIGDLITSQHIRPQLLGEEIAAEHHLGARQRWLAWETAA